MGAEEIAKNITFKSNRGYTVERYAMIGCASSRRDCGHVHNSKLYIQLLQYYEQTDMFRSLSIIDLILSERTNRNIRSSSIQVHTDELHRAIDLSQ